MPNKLHLECQYKKLADLCRKYEKVEQARSRAVAPYETKMELYEQEVYNIAKKICIYYNDKTAIEALQNIILINIQQYLSLIKLWRNYE